MSSLSTFYLVDFITVFFFVRQDFVSPCKIDTIKTKMWN